MKDRFFIDTNILIYFVSNDFEFSIIKKETIKLSFELMTKHKYSYWDSLIIASALENNCAILYTEDMQSGQIIEDRLKIINPYKQK